MDLKTFADGFLRYRLQIAIVVLLVTAAAVVGISRLGFDDNPRAVFRSDDEEFRLMEEVFAQFGTDDNQSFLIVRSESLFSEKSLAELRRLTADVQAVDGVAAATSMTDPRILIFDPLSQLLSEPLIPVDLDDQSDRVLDETRAAALAHPLTAKQLVNDRGDFALVIATLDGEELTISQIQPVDRKLQSIAERFSRETSLDVRLTGLPSIRVDAFSGVRRESARFTIQCSIAAFAVAVLILRSWQMVVVVCLASTTSALWSVGALGLVGEQITVLSVVLPTLVMVVGFTDAVHLVVDVRHSRALGLPAKTAARDALRHLTVACGLTSLTTAIGFASLGVTKTEIVRRFGLACGAGAVLTFLAVISIVPLLCSTRLGNGMLPARTGARINIRVATFGRLVIDAVLRMRWLITVLAVVLAVVMAVTASRLEPEHQIAESLPEDSEAVRTLEDIDREFGGMLPAFVIVDWPSDVTLESDECQQALAAVHKACEESPATENPFSILNIIRAVPGGNLGLVPESATRRLLHRADRRTVVVCRSKSRGVAYYSKTFPRLVERLKRLEEKFPGFRFRLTGSGVVASKNLGLMISDLASSLGLAFVVIFVTLTIVFRSIRIGLICIIPNALPLLLTASLLVWTGESLRFSGVIVFCVCLGIAVDDTIHVVSRFQRELKLDGDIDAALKRSMRAVGSALVVTTLVLIVGFSVTLTSTVPGNRMFGGLACTAIASALLGDLIVLPAMLACFAKRHGKATSV